MPNIPRTEFAQALAQIANERGLEPAVILETIKAAILAAFRRDAKEKGLDIEGNEYDVEINPDTGEARVFLLEEKGKERRDVTPPGFGRIAAQTAKQVILQKIREAEKDTILADFQNRVGNLVSGIVLRFDGSTVRVDIGRADGVMPVDERIPGERLKLNQRASFIIKEIKETPRGKEIILSRSSSEFVKKLFAREVPEIALKSVEIKAIARDPGSKTKIAVASNQSGVDPVGSCVGQKGTRVQTVINELNGEKIDIIPWSDDPKQLIMASLAPAKDLSVEVNQKNKLAVVKVPSDQLSLAIGKDGQNVRLAAQLTGYKISIEGKELQRLGETKETRQASSQSDIVKLELPANVKRALVSAGIKTLEELKSKSVKDLENIKGIGPKTIEYVKPLLTGLPKSHEKY